jgi:hypothetical protein
MNRTRSLAGLCPLVLVLPLAGGCNTLADAITSAPYDQGLTWTGQESTTSVTTSFRATASGGAVPGKSTVGFGSSCGVARTISGTFERTENVRRDHTNEVVGNTVTDHPLNPGVDVFAQIGLSIVAEQVVTTGDFQQVETFADPDGEQREWEERDAGDDGQQTAARYHGVAADEYIVSMFPLDLWVSTDGATADTPPTSEFDRANSLTLLSRHNPRNGDTWTSTNNTTLYTYAGSESLNVGGNNVRADKVFVYSNEDFAAGDVLATCLKVGPFEDQTTQDELDSIVTESVVLDGGCEVRYQHRQTGTEWWYGDTLVQFQGERIFVDISDFGYEWYEQDGDFCTRFTSTTRPTDVGDAELFVEYTVTTETSNFVVDTWDVIDPFAGE